MTEEENICKISIPILSDYEIRQIDNNMDTLIEQFTRQIVHDKDLTIAQHIIQKQQEKIKKLQHKNENLLRKLRNRIKEVKKLSKYSLYKEEFSRLNAIIKKKDKQIDLMAEYIKNPYQLHICKGRMSKIKAIREYFEKHAEEV